MVMPTIYDHADLAARFRVAQARYCAPDGSAVAYYAERDAIFDALAERIALAVCCG